MGITLGELGWLAGLLDGEACFAVKYSNVKRHLSNPTGNLSINVTVQASSWRTIEELGRLFGLMDVRHVRPNTHRHKRSRKLIHRIDVCRKADVERLLMSVLPFLKVKDAEAREILAYFAAFPTNRTDKKSTPEDRARLFIVVRDLKKVA